MMSQVIRLVNTNGFSRFSEINLSLGQPAILIYLSENDGAMQGQFAAALSLRPATVTVTLKRMERAGLIRRETDRMDLRVSRVFMTEKGRAVLGDIRRIRAEIDAVCLQGFTLDEVQQLRDMMQRMLINLNTTGEDQYDLEESII